MQLDEITALTARMARMTANPTASFRSEVHFMAHPRHEPVVLEPGIYYAVSVETVGGDEWVQEAAVTMSCRVGS